LEAKQAAHLSSRRSFLLGGLALGAATMTAGRLLTEPATARELESRNEAAMRPGARVAVRRRQEGRFATCGGFINYFHRESA
jgi:hypothetical protein